MAERRSLGAAMEMTPAKLAFIKGELDKNKKVAGVDYSTSNKTEVKTIDLKDPGLEPEGPKEQRPKETRRPSRGRSAQNSPEASEILDQVLVPITMRLQHKTAQALKRAYLEQKLKHAKPDTIQEIGEEAVADWLLRAGYLD